MKIVTDYVLPDEPCHGLQEIDRLLPQADGAWQLRRIQAVYVVRGDSIAEYVTDLGSAEDFADVAQSKMLATGELTVAAMQAEAEHDRHDTFYRSVRNEMLEGSTLIQDFITLKERNWEIINNRSVFGGGVTKQRNGFSKRAAYEKAGRRGT